MSSSAKITPPEKICSDHNFENFDSGEPVLDDWLRERALENEVSRASRTYVVCSKDRVVGYYALATGAVKLADAPGRVKRNMPNPVPVMVICRLAVDQDYQGRGIGRGLLRDAVLRIIQAAEIAGIRAILVHALSEDSKQFYESCGFRPSPIDVMTLMITLDDAKKALIDT